MEDYRKENRLDKLDVLLCLTDNCNFRCEMCDLWKKSPNKSPKINIDDCKKMITTLKNFDLSSICVHLIGGEPLLKNSCLELVKFIAENGFESVITTNAYFIDVGMAKEIANSGLNIMNLSLEGMNDKTHDFLRGVEGSHQRVMEAITHLDRFCKNLKLGINTIILEKNLDEIIELAEWVNKHDRLNYIYFMAVMQPFGSEPDRFWYEKDEFRFLWPQNVDKVNFIIDQLINLKESGYKIENSISQLKVFKSYFTNPQKFIKKTKCNLGKSAININVYGDVYLCFFLDCLGNIRMDNIKEIWHSEKAKQVREKIIECQKNCELLVNCYYEEDLTIQQEQNFP